MADGPLLVYGPRSGAYDFGPGHPLTPRRFGPGIDLLAALGVRPGLAPEPATDDELLAIHTRAYLAAVRRFSADPSAPPEAGIGPGDNPPFRGMHEAAASVAGGSLRAVEAILRGDVEHAFHPGGGLHHALADRASGFCIYNDPALAIARARAAGRRVLYVDLDVHHGDGVQAIHQADPGVLTVSFHESGRYLFPGTGAVDELGQGEAAGTVVNVPFEPLTGEQAWLAAIELLLPLLAATFGPDLIVSQHGADSHAWDPLAHLRVTTTAMGAAARLVDRVAHRRAGGAWLATGGGGYDVYRVVPRAWALTWLAGAHREVPEETPPAWRARWAEEARRHGQAPLPERFHDGPNAGLPLDAGQRLAEARAIETAALVRSIVVPALLREAADRSWWSPIEPLAGRGEAVAPAPKAAGSGTGAGPAGGETPTVVGPLDRRSLERLALAARVIAPADPLEGRAILAAAAGAGLVVVAAVRGTTIVGVAVIDPGARPGPGGAPVDRGGAPVGRLLAIGVAPAWRRQGLARALLARALAEVPPGRIVEAIVVVGERDPLEPLDAAVRHTIAERLLRSAGFRFVAPAAALAATDPWAIRAQHNGMGRR
ncbi:MAG: acetoin utilization protein AcuC [Chloroflexota bacterium]